MHEEDCLPESLGHHSETASCLRLCCLFLLSTRSGVDPDCTAAELFRVCEKSVATNPAPYTAVAVPCGPVPSSSLVPLEPVPYTPQARGDVPSLSLKGVDDFNGTVAMSLAGSLEGIAPLWGTFELTYGGETTAPLYVDATAGKLKWGVNGSAPS